MKLKTTLNSIITITLLQSSAWGATCNNKLDSYFESLPHWLNQSAGVTDLHKSCVAHSMNAFAGWAQSFGYEEDGKKGVFVHCSEESNDNYTRTSIPQCQTEAYINTTLNSYMNVSDCLGVNFENLYPIIAAESGFYHNAFSPSGKDFGFGQVTDPAIHDVNLSWNRFVNEMKDSQKQSCKNLIDFIEKENLQPVDEDYHCTLTRAPQNPLLNVIYTGMHYRLISSYMEMHSEETFMRSRMEEFLGPYFTPERYQKVKDILTILSYNLGHEGTVMAFEEFFLEKKYKLEQMILDRKELTGELAEINFALMELANSELRAQKDELLAQLNQMDEKIKEFRHPRIFNGDESTPESFGKFIVDKRISYYLKILRRRVNYISKKDRANVCPTDSILHIVE